MNSIKYLQAENERLRQKLEESEELIDAIRKGRVDALVISGDRQEAVYTLEGADHTYRVLIENMHEGAVTLSARGTILYCNRRFAEMLQRPIETLTGSAIEGLIPPEERQGFQAHLENVPASGVKIEFHLLDAAGFQIPCLVSLNPLPLEEIGLLCMVVTDLTEQKVNEETLKSFSLDLQTKNTELQRRTEQLRRLTSELTMAEQRERKRVSHMLHDGLQQYLASAKLQLGSIAEQMSGQILHGSICEVEDVLAESIQMTRSLSTELSPPILYQGGLGEGLEWLVRWMRQMHGLDVNLTIESEEAMADEVKLLVFEAVRELLFNAVKHAKVTQADVLLSVDGADHLKVTVSDQGAGFDPERVQLESGKGFGLFSIRERIEFWNGRLEIHSLPGQGSRFVLVVPRNQPPAEASMLDMIAKPTVSLSGKGVEGSPSVPIRVLLVDDHTLFRDGIARMLSREPDISIVGQAGDGLQAIEMSRRLLPHVILMDIGMPGVSGIEATRVIHREMPDIRIVALSMYNDNERILVMRNAGAVDYRVKDCAVSELLSAIRDPKRCACDLHRAANAAPEATAG